MGNNGYKRKGKFIIHRKIREERKRMKEKKLKEQKAKEKKVKKDAK